MPQIPPFSFDQQSPMHMPSSLQQPPFHPFYQPDTQPFNPNSMMFDQLSGISFQPYDLPPPDAYPNYTSGPIDTSAPLFYQQEQLPMQMQNVSIGSQQFAPPPHMHQHSPPIRPQQTTPPNVTNKATLQFVPSQVLRNIPKKS